MRLNWRESQMDAIVSIYELVESIVRARRPKLHRMAVDLTFRDEKDLPCLIEPGAVWSKRVQVYDCWPFRLCDVVVVPTSSLYFDVTDVGVGHCSAAEANALPFPATMFDPLTSHRWMEQAEWPLPEHQHRNDFVFINAKNVSRKPREFRAYAIVEFTPRGDS
jgi:hypothetical protein